MPSSSYALECLPDDDRSFVDFNVLPHEAERFPKPESCRQHRDEQRFQSMGRTGHGEDLRLGRVNTFGCALRFRGDSVSLTTFRETRSHFSA